jgi:hypothetical protein
VRQAHRGKNDLNSLDELLRHRLGLLTGAQFDYRRLAVEEIMKYSRNKMVSMTSISVHSVQLCSRSMLLVDSF